MNDNDNVISHIFKKGFCGNVYRFMKLKLIFVIIVFGS